MKKRMLMIALTLAMAGWVQAQEFRLAKSTGRLELRIGRAVVEGYSGNEIIFTSFDFEKEHDERAKGLREINGLGLDDNTGLGINVSEKGDVITALQLKKMNSPNVKIQVPRGIIVYYGYESQYGNDVKFINLENEIEISTNYNSVELENVTGPLTVKTIYGHVEASLSPNAKSPVSIVSVYGYADVTLPETIKASLQLSTTYGEIYVAPELKISMDKPSGDSDRVIGKINGGGIQVDINSSYGKVYLRKK